MALPKALSGGCPSGGGGGPLLASSPRGGGGAAPGSAGGGAPWDGGAGGGAGAGTDEKRVAGMGPVPSRTLTWATRSRMTGETCGKCISLAGVLCASAAMEIARRPARLRAFWLLPMPTAWVPFHLPWLTVTKLWL